VSGVNCGEGFRERKRELDGCFAWRTSGEIRISSRRLLRGSRGSRGLGRLVRGGEVLLGVELVKVKAALHAALHTDLLGK
jgi:hypothetical protein